MDELILEAIDLLGDAERPQWQASRYGAGGGQDYSDPTGDTAVDPRRLALRAEVEATEAALERLSAARTRLRAALAAWAGEPI